MPKKRANGDTRKDNIAGLKMPSVESTLQIQPRSHVEFKSSWSLSHDALDAGLQAATQNGAKANLVLRAYSLTADSSESDFSDIWQDFTIDRKKGSRCFTLPKPTPKIRAVLGLINDSGRFSPLVRGKAVALPPSPDQLATQNKEDRAQSLDNAAAPHNPASEVEQAESPGVSPPAGQNGYHSPPSHALAKEANTTGMTSQSAEAFFNAGDEVWTESAPIELRAEFVVFGRVTPGTKLLMGGQIVEAGTDGSVEWKQTIGSFKQVWPLLQEALEMPSVEASPSLEFFQNVEPEQKLIELRGALKITGRVNHPEYLSMLPKELNVDASGVFKLSRMLPDGAVILPGLSLIAAK